jgi:hypothetical protein
MVGVRRGVRSTPSLLDRRQEAPDLDKQVDGFGEPQVVTLVHPSPSVRTVV